MSVLKRKRAPVGSRPAEFAAKCVAQIKLLSDHTRFAVIQQLMVSEHTFHDLTRTLSVEPTLLSHHLKLLRDGGFIDRSRLGRNATYRIAKTRLVDGELSTIQLGCCTIRMRG